MASIPNPASTTVPAPVGETGTLSGLRSNVNEPESFSGAGTAGAGSTATAADAHAGAGLTGAHEPVVPSNHPAGEGGIMAQAKTYLGQVDKAAKPYVEQIQAATQPYADKLKTMIEGKDQPHGAHGDLAAPGTASTGLHATGTTGTAQSGATVGEQAKGMLNYGLGALKSALNTVGETIDSKTATAEKPGLYTQASQVAKAAAVKVEAALEGTHAGATGATGATGTTTGLTGATHDSGLTGVTHGTGSTLASTGGSTLGGSTLGGSGSTLGSTTLGSTGVGATAPAADNTGLSAASANALTGNTASPIHTTTNTLPHNSNDADPKY